MRETRPSGSVEGVLSNGHPHSDSHHPLRGFCQQLEPVQRSAPFSVAECAEQPAHALRFEDRARAHRSGSLLCEPQQHRASIARVGRNDDVGQRAQPLYRGGHRGLAHAEMARELRRRRRAAFIQVAEQRRIARR